MKRTTSTLIALVIALYNLYWPTAEAQNMIFRHYDTANGLSQNTVNSIVQDRQGFMWFATKDGLTRFDGLRFRVFRMTEYGLPSNFVNTICEDTDGNIWIGTEHGLCIYRPQTERVEPLRCEGDSLISPDGSIRRICSDGSGHIFIATTKDGLLTYDCRHARLAVDSSVPHTPISYCGIINGTEWIGIAGDNLYSKSGGNFKRFAAADGQMPFNHSDVNDMAVAKGRIYVASDHGLFLISPQARQVRQIQQGFFRTLSVSADGSRVWAGSESGIYVVNVQTAETTAHITQPDIDDPLSIQDNAIYSIYTDREGSIWIGSYFGGVNYLPAHAAMFEVVYPAGSHAFMGRRIREMVQDAEGTIWIGTEDKGLLRYEPQSGALAAYPTHLRTDNIHGLCIEGGYLYVGAFDGGMERINLADGTYRTYFASNAQGALKSNYVFSIFSDTDHNIWVGTTGGLQLFNPADESFRTYPDGLQGFVYHITEDQSGRLWVATYDNGLYAFDPSAQRLTHYRYQNHKPGTIADSKVISVFPDSKNRIWVMTHDGGLSRLDVETGQFHPIMPHDTGHQSLVMRIVEDMQGSLWCSTGGGLIKYNPETDSKQLYTTGDGLHTNHFNYQSGLIDREGYIYFGTINGFIRFRPDRFKIPDYDARIALTALYVNNREVLPTDDDSPIDQSIDLTESLTLSGAIHTSFAITPQVMSYVMPETENIRYKLEGFDTSWQTLTDKYAPISYAKLPYGHYTLRIVCDADDAVSVPERILAIYIKPPFYLSTFAKVIYTLAAIALVAFLIWNFYNMERRRMKYAREKLEQDKQRELYDSKITFFTNIAHEIRTPLTLIKSPLENILQQTNIPANLKEDLNLMDLNAGRLVALVNQLLDFRRTEQDNIRLNIERVNISDAVNQIVKVFTPLINQRGLQLTATIDDGVWAYVDRDIFGKIVSNIINNAVKYAASTISLKLSATESTLQIVETNDGTIVPEHMREEIFHPFVRYDSADENKSISGTGIGLALIRSLVTLHGGSIVMDDDQTVNRFVLTMPLRQDDDKMPTELMENTEGTSADARSEIPADAQETMNEPDQQGGTARQSLLIVEDNRQLQDFLARHLADKYNIHTADEGELAINILNDERIDIVVSDIMMPNVDGLELCNYVKENVAHSHIPVILLTAKTTEQARLEGLRHGADAYIDKPFSMQVLEQTIQMLIENRQRLYTSFMQRPYAVITSMVGSEVENEFITRLGREITEHLDDSEFDVDRLAAAMNMSRSSLNRKIKATLGMTPNDCIRVERLKKAVELLKTKRYKVNEVCYMVGFNTPSYFTKCFQQQYGILPSDVE